MKTELKAEDKIVIFNWDIDGTADFKLGNITASEVRESDKSLITDFWLEAPYKGYDHLRDFIFYNIEDQLKNTSTFLKTLSNRLVNKINEN